MRATANILLALTLSMPAFAADNIVHIDQAVQTLRYHLRLKPARISDTRCSLIWNYLDSANYQRFDYEIPAVLSTHQELGFDGKYKVVSVIDGQDNVLDSGEYHSDYPNGDGCGFSVILTAQSDYASVSLGGKKLTKTIEIPFERKTPGAIGYRSEKALEELQNEVLMLPSSPVEWAEFESIEALEEYLRSSTDGYEGLWMYLDRDTEPTKAHLGGRYALATISDGNGGYKIVYLDGANAQETIWQPLMIKGHLRPTVFRDHFDLKWLDAAGDPVLDEGNATYEIEGMALKITLPLHKATLRFSRIKN